MAEPNPPANIDQQIGAHLTDLAGQNGIAEHVPAVLNNMAHPHGEPAQILDIIHRLDQLQASVNGLQATVNAGQQRLPIQLANLITPFDGQLRYPLEEVPPWFPQTKLAILELTIPALQAVANHLGLEPLPPGTLVDVRQRQITEFLGCGF
ncbi:hypothetical protein EDB89DRAFT_2065457 [Lactarius sanguifluus]|nr:hypothetical protein EDB89DRAFT_2065457 [Lactarius sanguifluus]